ncbi:thioredoxin family protein [Aliiroseovarius subalbicans]|uniref:thioredoxin family protein n=1 Tax=Aliiroseovarius subalbicans TaxID=2925840 RepID=UPI001F5953F6|nr:thioredoxin family protein [Aliiroseovarius subalbicans]MCI2398120.1 thioredoxin family protein [Aliiroseovarius subalbicans]
MKQIARAFAFLIVFAGVSLAAELGDDGLHKQPWFLDSFLEMQDDLAEAAAEGKDLLILFEQAGCPYCRELHEVNFARNEIVSFLTEHYVVVQLDMFGAREVVDFDGEALEERALAVKWGVNFTPMTLMFSLDGDVPQNARAAEAFRLPGYLKPFHYLSSLEFVATDAYQNQHFQRFLQAKFEHLAEQGVDPDVW